MYVSLGFHNGSLLIFVFIFKDAQESAGPIRTVIHLSQTDRPTDRPPPPTHTLHTASHHTHTHPGVKETMIMTMVDCENDSKYQQMMIRTSVQKHHKAWREFKKKNYTNRFEQQNDF